MHADRPLWMSFYFSDFFNDEWVQLMNNAQLGLYWNLLKHAWNATPAGTIPKDRETLYKISGCADLTEFNAGIKGVLKCFEVNGDDRLVQKRLQSEYQRANGLRKRRSDAGKIGRSTQLKNKEIQANAGQSAGKDLLSLSLSSNSKSTKRKRSAEGKPKRAAASVLETVFSKSPLATWPAFRQALHEWPEEKARYYYDLFTEKEMLHPTKYKYARWDLAARAWDRRAPNEWKHQAASQPLGTLDDLLEKVRREKK